MSIEQELKGLILEQYKSIRAFSLEVDIPYSTIDTMLKRGISGTAISTVTKICNALDIDTDSLSRGVLRKRLHVARTSFTYAEEAHIKKYRVLDAHGKKTVDLILDNEYERCKPLSDDTICFRDSGLRAAHNDNTSPEQLEKMNIDLDWLDQQ